MNETTREYHLFFLLRQGDEAAYLELYDLYKEILYNHAHKKLGNADDAGDIVQELFIYLWENRANTEVPDNVTAYLFTAIRNRILNHLAKKGREAAHLISLAGFINGSEYSTDLTLRERELERMIESEVNRLPKRMREVFILSRNEGLSHKEISEQLGTSEQTISKQITNTLKILRVKLETILTVVLTLLLVK